MEEVRNGLGTEALDSLSKHFAEQYCSVSKLHVSAFKRHELIRLLPGIHTVLTEVQSSPSSKSVNALAKALAGARCLTSGAEFNVDQESQCMQKFTKSTRCASAQRPAR